MELEFKSLQTGEDQAVFLDGKKIGFSNGLEETYPFLGIKDFDTISDHNISEFKMFETLEYLIPSESLRSEHDLFQGVFKVFTDTDNSGINHPFFIFSFGIDLTEWNKSYSFTKYKDLVSELYSEEKGYEIELTYEDTYLWLISKQLTRLDIPIGKLYASELSKLLSYCELADSQLSSETNDNMLLEEFEFPSEFKEACEQYLVYFTRFLKDIGINAKSSIQSNGDQSIFKVVPENVDQALSQIRDALNAYLLLPNSSELEQYSNQFNDVGVQQLVSQIYHLKSQLMLGHAQIQMKDATIDSLNLTIYQQNKLIESNQTDSSLEIFGGIVTVKKYKGKGFDIDIPKLFKMIRRRFDENL